jgi:thioredoxin-related protein
MGPKTNNHKTHTMDAIKLITYSILSLILLHTAPALAAEKVGAVTGGIEYEPPEWFKESFLEIAEDVEEANDEGRHVLLFFHLNACPYCERMLRENFGEDPLKSQIQENFDSIAINIKGDREIAMNEKLSTTERLLAEYLKVQYTPTILFLDGSNRTVLRLDGYRSPEALKQALDFVSSKAYKKTSFSAFKRNNMNYGKYAFIDDPLIKTSTDLSKHQGPVALLFEDDDCNECSIFHGKLMKRPEIRAALKRLDLIRLDAKSTRTITGFDGKPTTPLKLAESLNVNYRPGIVLFDEGKEVNRVESMLFPWHFENVILHALDKNYKKYPRYLDLASARQDELIARGIDVNVGKPLDW